MRKVDDGEKKRKKKKKKKIMTFIVATNVIASRPPERRPTGTPHAHAKNGFFASFSFRYTKWVKSFTLLRLHDEAFIFVCWLQVKFHSFVNLKMLQTG